MKKMSINLGKVHIYCGDGKGKTTCAAGLALRCCGSGGRVLWFQFLKDGSSGECVLLEQQENITVLAPYSKVKFSFQMTEQEKRDAALFYQNAFEQLCRKAAEETFDMLVLDELFAAISVGFLEEKDVLAFLRGRPQTLEVVLTGRNPPQAFIDCADYVSEIRKVKHPFDQGLAARKMIEW